MTVYLDTSIVLARLFAEDRSPPDGFWSQTLVASRLLEYEVFCHVHARNAGATHGDAARRLVDRVSLVEMSTRALGRAVLAFAPPLRTLDTLHLATTDFLHQQGQPLALATYDQRLATAATALGFALAEC
ncbi:MAG: PIN domain-containing protein [Burkholderiaceae bacterium]|nr:PIN domain-containing protein [Burkholderiaceae bacterium]